MKKIISILLLITFLVFPILALANGLVFKFDPYLDDVDFMDIDHQQVFINYQNGIQRMILSIGIEEGLEDAVWIFPVPANPDRVVIDIVTELPRLEGREINNWAESELEDTQEFLLNTQIYPFFIAGILEPTKDPFLREITAPGIEMEMLPPGVIVHERLVKEGITTEIITTETAQALYQYLWDKGLNIEKGAIPILDHYIGKEFTFVISWITEREQLRGDRGVFVTFPTEKIFYPLIPTSVYGSEVVPMTIRVIGFVSPEIFGDIKHYTEVEYLIDERFRIIPELKNFFRGKDSSTIEYLKYTKIEITAPSKMLTDDLLMTDRAPLGTIYPAFVVKHPVVNTIFLLILISIITGLIAGVIIFKEVRSKRGLIKFGLLGIANCFSIIGLIFATAFVKTKKIKDEDRELFEKLKQKKYSGWSFQIADKRKFIFIPLFSVLFLLISFASISLLNLIL